jgi:hypothetical protein
MSYIGSGRIEEKLKDLKPFAETSAEQTTEIVKKMGELINTIEKNSRITYIQNWFMFWLTILMIILMGIQIWIACR